MARIHTHTYRHTYKHTHIHLVDMPQVFWDSLRPLQAQVWSFSVSFLAPSAYIIAMFVLVCCSMRHAVAVYCGVLQCVAVCCSVLKRVEACCSVLQYVAGLFWSKETPHPGGVFYLLCSLIAVCCIMLQTACCMTHLHFWHNAFKNMTWRTRTCAVSHFYMILWPDMY